MRDLNFPDLIVHCLFYSVIFINIFIYFLLIFRNFLHTVHPFNSSYFSCLRHGCIFLCSLPLFSLCLLTSSTSPTLFITAPSKCGPLTHFPTATEKTGGDIAEREKTGHPDFRCRQFGWFFPCKNIKKETSTLIFNIFRSVFLSPSSVNYIFFLTSARVSTPTMKFSNSMHDLHPIPEEN